MAVRVSVVVPTYKRPELLSRCLQALLSQDFDPSAYEVIVVDDAADETTRRLVEAWSREAVACAYLPGLDLRQPVSAVNAPIEAAGAQVQVRGSWALLAYLPRLRYIPAARRRGPAAARNCGWQAASGEFIAFTDDDCIPVPNWLKEGVRALESGAQGASGRVIVPLPPEPTDYERDAAGLSRSVFVTANSFYQRSALALAGGFDETFTLPWREDSDLYFRLRKLGCELIEVPGAVVVHPLRPAAWGVSLRQQRKSMFNALLYKKHPDLYRRTIQLNPPWHYYTAVASLGFALIAALFRSPTLALFGLYAWTGLTLGICARRLQRTSHRLNHLVEMLVTSALIPPLSVYWRLRGAVKFRVFFL